MGEGLGGWGHATRRKDSTPEFSGRSTRGYIFFRGGFWGMAGAAVRGRPLGQIRRQIDLPAVRKFEITQMDKAAAALDDIARAGRDSARKTTDLSSHGTLPVEMAPPTQGNTQVR